MTELWDVSCHMGSHSVACYPTQVNMHCFNPSLLAGTRFTYPGGMEGWVDLLLPIYLAVHWPGFELVTSRFTSPGGLKSNHNGFTDLEIVLVQFIYCLYNYFRK